MSFQADVRQFQTTGLPGEVAREGPLRASPWNLDSAAGTGSPNIIGFAFTKVADGDVQAGGDISAGDAFVGILGRPKEHALIGTGTSALTATDILADGVVASFIDMGIIYVNLTTAANVVGAAIFFNDVTGALGAGVAGVGESVIPNARLVYEDIPVAGLAIIQLTN